VAEIFRGGIQSIERGQVEAGRSLGLSHTQTMRKIILPQAFRRMIPPFVNEAVALLKFSSLVSVLGVADLTYKAQVLSSTTFRPIEIFTSIAVVYFVLCTALSYAAKRLELRLAVPD
jgi:ABC-type amino acid transport system permease subunit